MPKAGRKGDIGSDHPAGWPPSPAIEGSPDVNTNGRPALRKGDAVAVHAKPGSPPHPRAVSQGSSTVNINGKPAARVGDGINCGGSVATGSGNVFIGDTSWSGGAPMPDKPKLRLYLTQVPGTLMHPYSNEPYKLYKDGGLVQTGFTDESGMLEYEYEAPWTSVLKVETPLREFTYNPIPFGPVDTQTGAEQRLDILGYYDRPDTGEATQGYIQRYEFFQGNQEAEITGQAGEGLSKAIKPILP